MLFAKLKGGTKISTNTRQWNSMRYLALFFNKILPDPVLVPVTLDRF